MNDTGLKPIHVAFWLALIMKLAEVIGRIVFDGFVRPPINLVIEFLLIWFFMWAICYFFGALAKLARRKVSKQ